MIIQTTQAKIFQALVEPHLTYLYKTAYRLTGNREEAEDLVQEVLVKIYPKTSEMKKIEMLAPWLRKVLHRQFIDGLRKKTRRPEHFLSGVPDETDNIKSPMDNPETFAQRAENHELLLSALDILDKQQRSIIVMHLAEGYTLNEMAQIYSLPLETLKTKLRRAKAKLKKYLRM